MSEVIKKIEKLVGKTVRRDISRLVKFAEGQMEEAAKSIAEHPSPRVGIISGFFVRNAEPPSPETDGLNGMGQLAAGLTEAGVPVTLITDVPCAKAVWAVSRILPHSVNIEVVSVESDSVLRLRNYLESCPEPLTHLIAIERCSLAADGKPHREHGWDISEDTAPLDFLFEDNNWTPPWRTIGIGDGGNEIGMGKLPSEIVEGDIPNGKLIAAKTKADYLIVSGVSNWGAYGLLAAVASLRPDKKEMLLKYFDGAFEHKILDAAVNIGQAIDDSRVDRPGQLQMTIDRLPINEHVYVIDGLKEILKTSSL